MPSSSTTDDDPLARRRVLAGIGAAATGILSGCSGRVPGTGPAELDVETTLERGQNPRLLWEYPPRDGDADGIGYGEVEIDRIREGEMRLTFNSTIGGIASEEPYTGYRPDWFRFRIRPPEAYESRLNYVVRVEPPGQWEGFSAYYDVGSTVRETIVALHGVDTQGTIRIPAVFESEASSLPHCAFAVQASRPGVLGRTVRAAARDTLVVPEK